MMARRSGLGGTSRARQRLSGRALAPADPVARTIQRLMAVGGALRRRGAHLEVVGGAITGDLRQELGRHWRAIQERLAEDPTIGADLRALIQELGVAVVLVEDAAEAKRIIAALPELVGLDLETYDPTEPPPPLRITAKGTLHSHQAKPAARGGLDPNRARIRTVQVFASDHPEVVGGTSYVFDMHAVPWTVLEPLWQRELIIHNAAFELSMLAALDIRPERFHCSTQIFGLAAGLHRHGSKPGRALATAVAIVTGKEPPKEHQISDWSAPVLHPDQVLYAGLDPALAHLVAGACYPLLRDNGGERAYELQRAALPVVAELRRRGLPFDVEVHRATIREWSVERAEARARFEDLAGVDVPKEGQQTRTWIRDRLPAGTMLLWPKTRTGELKTERAVLSRHAAHHPELEALLEVRGLDTRISTFGDKLISYVVDGRLPVSLSVAGADTGRFTSSKPNMQNLPRGDVRRAVIAPEARTLVVGDWSQMELRACAELAGAETMRSAFRDGIDLHKLTASRMAGVAYEDVTKAQRQAAKAPNFGAIFNQQAEGLAETAWANYGVLMSPAEAQRALDAFFGLYPEVRDWQRRTFTDALATGVARTWSGRPLYPAWCWRDGWEFKPPKIANYHVQGSCADVALIALVTIEQALAGTDADLLLNIHDEFVVESSENAAAEAAEILEREMVAAFLEVFPDAPPTGLVEVDWARCWADAKE